MFNILVALIHSPGQVNTVIHGHRRGCSNNTHPTQTIMLSTIYYFRSTAFWCLISFLLFCVCWFTIELSIKTIFVNILNHFSRVWFEFYSLFRIRLAQKCMFCYHLTFIVAVVISVHLNKEQRGRKKYFSYSCLMINIYCMYHGKYI